jgi:hypothetical protein
MVKGASKVKWTTFDPCTCLGESDPKQYTHLTDLWKKNPKLSKNICIESQSQTIFIE